MVAVIIDTNCPASNTEMVALDCLMKLRDDHQRDYKDDFALQDFLDRFLGNSSPR